MSEISVLIAERGSLWLDWARAWRTPAHALVLIFQDVRETQHELLERVAERLAHFDREGKQVTRVALIAGQTWDAPALLARAQMVRALLSRFAKRAQRTQLLLDTGVKNSPAALGMRAIAEALGDCIYAPAAHLQLTSGPAVIG